MRQFLSLVTLFAILSPSAFPLDRHDWQEATGRLHSGDKVHVSLKTGATDATFISSTPQDLTADSGTLKKEDVLQIVRVRTKKGGSRGRHALIGTIVGAGGGAAFGAIVGRCDSSKSFLVGGCFTPPGETVAVFTGLGTLIGAIIGALIPGGGIKRETIYSVN